MLILSRKKNESLVINHNITVSVVEIRGDKVRLGVTCPKEMSLHRQEVYDAVYREQPGTPLPTLAPPPIPEPVTRPPASPAAPPPVVSLSAAQATWLDHLAETLRARTGVVVGRDVLAQAILDVARQGLEEGVKEAEAGERK